MFFLILVKVHLRRLFTSQPSCQSFFSLDFLRKENDKNKKTLFFFGCRDFHFDSTPRILFWVSDLYFHWALDQKIFYLWRRGEKKSRRNYYWWYCSPKITHLSVIQNWKLAVKTESSFGSPTIVKLWEIL